MIITYSLAGNIPVRVDVPNKDHPEKTAAETGRPAASPPSDNAGRSKSDSFSPETRIIANEGALPFSSGRADSETSAPIWLHLEAPTHQECKRIAERFSLPLDYLTAALDLNERPRLEHQSDIWFVITRASLQNGVEQPMPFTTCPIAVALTPHALITVCKKKDVVQELLCHENPGTGPVSLEYLMFMLLLRISTTFIEHLRRMEEMVEKIEDTLKASMQNKELLRMLQVEKSLIYLYTALKGNQAVMEKILSNTRLLSELNEQELLKDALIENKQALDMAEIFTNVMGSLSETFGAIVSNNLNKVMKILTGLTIVFIIPTIVAGIYGMNVALPMQDHPHAFVALSLISIVLSLGVLWALRKMNWM